MATLQENLNVSFSEKDETTPLALEFERFIPVIGNPAGSAIIRLYPDVDAELFASRGEISEGSSKFEERVAELVTFSQSNVANTQKIMDSRVTIEQSWLFDVTTGDRIIRANFVPTLGTTLITCDQTLTGVVLVTYRSSYKELEYIMEVEYTGYSPSSFTGSMIFHRGTVLAYYEGSTASLEVSPPALTAPTAQESRELYKVSSPVIVTSDGAWEKPDEWPEKNVYNDHPSYTGPEVGSAYVEHERIHEIGLVDEYGRYRNQTYYSPRRKPFELVSFYKPDYEFNPGYTATDISDSTCAVHYPAIINRLKSVYGFSDSDITTFGCSNR